MEKSKLTKNEMKKILGGLASGDGGTEDVASTCTATCSGGASVSVTCSSKQRCVSAADWGAQCESKTELGKPGDFKPCPSPAGIVGTANLMRDAGSITMLSSASSMLAQANAAPQSVLSLLK